MKFKLIQVSALALVSVVLVGLGFTLSDAAISQVTAGATTIPACGGSNFWGAWVGRNGATGTLINEVAFINNGNTTCRLTGYPQIQGYRDNRTFSLKADHIESNAFKIFPTIVMPRMSAQMVITTSALCSALNTGNRTKIQKVISENSYSVSIIFPNSRVAIPVHGLVLDVACGLKISELGWTK